MLQKKQRASNTCSPQVDQALSWRSTYATLTQEVKPYWALLAGGFILALASSAIEGGFALMLKPLVDQGVVERQSNWLYWMPVLLSGMIIFRGICFFFSQYLISKVARQIVLNLRQKLFAHSVQLDYREHKRLTSGEVTSTMIYTVEQLANTVSSCFLTIIGEGCLVVALIGAMFYVNWQLSSILIISIPFIAILVQLTSKRIRSISQKTLGNIEKMAHHVNQVFEGQKIVRVHNAQSRETGYFSQLLIDNRKQEIKSVMANAYSSTLIQVIIVIPFSFALWLLTYLPTITVGGFVTVIVALLRVLQPLKRLSNVNAEIQKGLVAAKKIYDTLNLPIEASEQHKKLAEYGVIRFENVNYSYGGNQTIHQLSLTIQPGQLLGIAGPSGGGKSTMITLLLQLLRPESGQITLNDCPIDQYQLASYRDLFAYVSQDTVLFSGSLYENIAYSSESIDYDRVKKAAKLACASDFIERLSDGYNTQIINGAEFSGGEKQRISIARALYKVNAPIIILDEATSGLDVATEKRVIENLKDPFVQDKTIIVIAHRLAAIEICHQILMMDKGEIVESGQHSTLLKSQGLYAKLHQLQYSQTDATSEDPAI